MHASAGEGFDVRSQVFASCIYGVGAHRVADFLNVKVEASLSPLRRPIHFAFVVAFFHGLAFVAAGFAAS